MSCCCTIVFSSSFRSKWGSSPRISLKLLNSYCISSVCVLDCVEIGQKNKNFTKLFRFFKKHWTRNIIVRFVFRSIFSSNKCRWRCGRAKIHIFTFPYRNYTCRNAYTISYSLQKKKSHTHSITLHMKFWEKNHEKMYLWTVCFFRISFLYSLEIMIMNGDWKFFGWLFHIRIQLVLQGTYVFFLRAISEVNVTGFCAHWMNRNLKRNNWAKLDFHGCRYHMLVCLKRSTRRIFFLLIMSTYTLWMQCYSDCLEFLLWLKRDSESLHKNLSTQK